MTNTSGTRKKTSKKKSTTRKSTSKKTVKKTTRKKVAKKTEDQLLREEYERKLALLQERENEIRLQEGLPFLYGWKWYPWAKKFYDSKNKINFLCAANQISKSSTAIRKCINWATNTDLWPELWPGITPNQFWYLYPSNKQANAEFETKWSEFLPQKEFKEHPKYGWKAKFKHGDIYSITFNTGIIIYFKTYKQNVHFLQSGTVHAMFCDEELPEALYDELIFRITAVDGYFHMVFTATMGQDIWRRTMEPSATEKEHLPHAHKQIVSMFDCMEYIDGTKSHWTKEKIQTAIARCKSKKEVDKRIYGKFIKEEGLKYPAYDPSVHFVEGHPIPKSWKIYAGIDSGSGGRKNHPSAIAFVAVDPTYTKGRVFLGWRGDGIETTSGDTLNKLEELKTIHKITPLEQRYDFADKDFYMIATRRGIPVLPADKKHETGEKIINVLFKHNMLLIYNTEELLKLSGELTSLAVETAKNKAKDDFVDALRYCVTTIPWDFSQVANYLPLQEKEEKLTDEERQIRMRRGLIVDNRAEEMRLEDEFDEWNEAYG